MKKRALISVSDKTGVVEFASGLYQLGYEIVSTGGTANVIWAAGVPVVNVSDVTGFPECLDGRVKTLHPMVHAGILAMRDNAFHMEQISKLGANPIDIVAINLYPFAQTILREEATLEDAIENIDIGGPSMLRAAAKNYRDVLVVVDPGDYSSVLLDLESEHGVSSERRFELACKVFEYTAAYDALIADYLRKEGGADSFPEKLTLTFEKVQDMRYGENPHQRASFYREIIRHSEGTLPAAVQLQGKELSYNNINDANGAISIVKEFSNQTVCVAVKHTNPCGVSVGATPLEAYKKAYEADPISIFGGIVATNGEINREMAQEISRIFLEIVIAPSYTEEALELLAQKKNLRVLRLPQISRPYPDGAVDLKKVAGGLLVQDINKVTFREEDFVCVTERRPSDNELRDLKFAYRVVKHTKSNAIVLAADETTVGVGPGQTNRITALQLAIQYGGEKVRGSVMASDAFFPFDDCVDAAAKAGIRAIMQPGGSIRDQDSIDACNRADIAMIFTGIRHFQH
jgi:phosphoribosylaminoimidazolecarboxamide formyltransferase/IMP cyclohydrolase